MNFSETLTVAIAALNLACDNADVTGADGEAVMFLDALLCMADGVDADEAVAIAYGIEATK